MNQFDNVMKELKVWMMQFSIVNMLIPLSLIVMFGGLGLQLLYEVIVYFSIQYFSILSSLSSFGHFAFLLGFWVTLISPNAKWAPYGLFANAAIILFPFSSFTLYSILSAGISIFFGYWLMRYVAKFKIEVNQ